MILKIGLLIGTTGQKVAWLLLKSPKTEVFHLIELYSGVGLEMEGHSGDAGEETEENAHCSGHLRQNSKSVELYLEDVLEMAGCLVDTGEETA